MLRRLAPADLPLYPFASHLVPSHLVPSHLRCSGGVAWPTLRWGATTTSARSAAMSGSISSYAWPSCATSLPRSEQHPALSTPEPCSPSQRHQPSCSCFMHALRRHQVRALSTRSHPAVACTRVPSHLHACLPHGRPYHVCCAHIMCVAHRRKPTSQVPFSGCSSRRWCPTWTHGSQSTIAPFDAMSATRRR
jgi:hypothetical protein